MAEVLLKSNAVSKLEETTQSEFPFSSLVTKALLDALCGALQTEIVFGKLERVLEPVTNAYWIEALVRGDLEGRLGLGCDEATLVMLTQGCRDGAAPVSPLVLKNTLVALHEKLVTHFEKQFTDEAFRCDFAKGSGFQREYQLVTGNSELFRCSVETQFGTLHVFLALKPNSKEIKFEIENQKSIDTSKKFRVYSGQIDSFAEQVNRIEQLEKRLLQGPEVRAQLRSEIKKMKRLLHVLRTESIDTIFLPAQKLVKDLSKSQGKQIQLEAHGTWLHLHKTLLNYIYEPILHLIRNAVDHGIEPPLVREQNGKKACGKVSVLASFNQGSLRILFSDDGRGLDFGLIREKAVAKGICSIEEANQKPNEHLAELIFQPGFTTRHASSQLSGRGLGLDIVKKALEAVGGTVRLVSTSTHGTAFELLIPMNEDFAPVSNPKDHVLIRREDEEKTQLLDELADYLDRLTRAIQALYTEKTIQSAYEGYRLVHLIKGICGFLGWQRVVGFLYPFEEVLKLLSEEKLPLQDETAELISEASFHLKSFCAASRTQSSYSLHKIRRSESRLLQLIWGATRNDDKTHLFIGKYHLNAVENFFLNLAKEGRFSVRPDSDFNRAIQLPYGALVQFSGDRRGFAGIFLPERTLTEVIHPLVTGSSGKINGAKSSLTSLSEFGALMGNQLAEIASRTGIQLQPAAPLTYYGLGEPTRALGLPTYCFQCEINGYVFYVAGDFRLPQDLIENTPLREPPTGFQSGALELVSDSLQKQLAEHQLKAVLKEEATQSDLIGFDGGITLLLSLASPDKQTPDLLVFLSMDAGVAEHLRTPQQSDLFDSLSAWSHELGNTLKRGFSDKRIEFGIGSPSVLVGKAYVANLNRLFLTSKLVGATEKGRIEAQMVITELNDEKVS
ncbi:hypothetical protein EBQ90_01850 [bacterium]|nr:hypothetical protein [bacterium]